MRMEPFPGVLEKKLVHYAYKYVLTDDQRQWLERWFPEIENRRLMAASGMSHSTLHRFAREMGLKKSEKGLHGIMKRQALVCKRVNERNGWYDSLRGKPVSDACKEGVRKMWEDIREGRRKHPIKRMSNYRRKKHAERMGAQRKELIRKEKLRVFYGLERQTALHLPIVPYTRSQVSHRNNALKRGYFYLDGKITGNDRYIIYYDDQTKRSEIFERNLVNDHFVIKEYKDYGL